MTYARVPTDAEVDIGPHENRQANIPRAFKRKSGSKRGKVSPLIALMVLS
jgi:hypothetical protein